MGDSVELVDGDFDDETDDDVDEQSNGGELRDFAENLLWINRAVKTSSSSSFSISESELFDADAAGSGASLPAARKFCSSSSNWPIKLRFGDMIGRANFTNLYASSSDSDLYRITYAIAMVALREMPAWQCNKTVDPFNRASSIRKKK